VVPFIDAGLMPGWAIANHFGLPYLAYSAAHDSSINKHLMKDRLLAAGVPTPRYIQVGSADDALAAARQLGLPCVIKPSAFGGSLGVRLIATPEQAAEAYEYAAKIIADNAATFTVVNRAIQVEEYCDLADEVSVEVLSHHGEHAALAVVDKSLGPRPFFAEMGHRVPSRYSGRDDIKDLALRACAAIGLDHGLAHVEVRCEGARQPQVIEVGARTAGGGIIDLLERALGIAPYELHVRSYLDRLDSLPRPQASGVAAIAILKAPPGRIVGILPPARVPGAVVSYEVFAAARELPEPGRLRGVFLAGCPAGNGPASRTPGDRRGAGQADLPGRGPGGRLVDFPRPASTRPGLAAGPGTLPLPRTSSSVVTL
jgi:predicted ATP-grasp superfamily ATP-dependent carboligase